MLNFRINSSIIVTQPMMKTPSLINFEHITQFLIKSNLPLEWRRIYIHARSSKLRSLGKNELRLKAFVSLWPDLIGFFESIYRIYE